MSAPERVLLTGINGFIGSHILANLLDNGISVRGVVRSQKKADQVLSDFPYAETNLDFAIVPDMTVAGAFDEALTSNPPFTAVIHTASPLNYSDGKSLADFVEPAVRGTMGILEGCNSFPSISKVVVTGSFASIGNPKDIQSNGKVYTSNDWNPAAVDDNDANNPRLAYWFSKTLAERAAWDFMSAQSRTFSLVVLNPPMVYGPLRHNITSPTNLNVSNNNIWRDFLNATQTSPLPAEWVHADIDVRDLAEAHVKALRSPNVANKRYLVSRGRISNQEIADILRTNFPEAVNRIPLGKPGSSSLPENAFDTDSSDAVKDLGLAFRSHEETFKDLGRQLLELGKGVPTVSQIRRSIL